MGCLLKCLGWNFNRSVSLETTALFKGHSVCPREIGRFLADPFPYLLCVWFSEKLLNTPTVVMPFCILHARCPLPGI
ncbi:mCG123850 [Mus musculus]|nr:mCG123850 [Mus musculus]